MFPLVISQSPGRHCMQHDCMASLEPFDYMETRHLSRYCRQGLLRLLAKKNHLRLSPTVRIAGVHQVCHKLKFIVLVVNGSIALMVNGRREIIPEFAVST